MSMSYAFAETDLKKRVLAFRDSWGPLYPLRHLLAEGHDIEVRTSGTPTIPKEFDGLEPSCVPVVLSLIGQSIEAYLQKAAGQVSANDGVSLTNAIDQICNFPGAGGVRFPANVRGTETDKRNAKAGLVRLMARHSGNSVELETVFTRIHQELWNAAKTTDSAHLRYLSDFDPTLRGSTDECLAHVKKAHQWMKQAEGRYRVFLPVTHPEDVPGALIAVEIAAVELDKAEPPMTGIVVAPWTFFLPSGGSDFTELRDALNDVLKKAHGIDASRLERLTFLLDLQPLAVSDLTNLSGENDEYERISALWPLMPSQLEVNGPSLGVAIGLAAWAAASQRLLRPVIATGTLDQTGAIGEIGGLKQKIAAAALFLSRARRKSSVVVPKDNSYQFQTITSDLQGHQRGNVATPATFQELLADPHNFLTDGFDDWRNFVGLGPSKQDKTGFDQSAFWTALNGKAPKPSVNHSAETDWASLTIVTSEDLPAVRCEGAVSELVTQLSDTIAKSPKGGLCYLTLAFQDEPMTPAGVVFEELVSKVWATKDRATLPDELVVVPINLADAELSALTDPASALACALRTRFSIQIEEAAFSNAAGQPGKLVLVVHDNPSNTASCWVEERFEPQRHLIAQLKDLAKTQWVIAICSDYHQECLWDDPLKKLREVPTAAADN